jgi:hypothetical protein
MLSDRVTTIIALILLGALFIAPYITAQILIISAIVLFFGGLIFCSFFTKW